MNFHHRKKLKQACDVLGSFTENFRLFCVLIIRNNLRARARARVRACSCTWTCELSYLNKETGCFRIEQ